MKSLNKQLRLLFIAILVTLSGKAQIDTTGANTQPWRCGIDSSLFSILNADSGFVRSMTDYNNAILSKTTSTVTAGPYIIPVVFHILSTTTSTTTISYEQIKWQVAALNAAYQNQMVQFTGKGSGPEAVSTSIQFRLACVSMPANVWTNATEPGVMRYATYDPNVLNQAVLDGASGGITNSSMLAITNPSGYFPKANYLNIYCVPNIVNSGGMVIGYGTFPSLNANIDGITMRLDCIGNNTYPTNFPMLSQLDKGRVLAHEAGHYLGLYHTFQPNIGGNFGYNTGCYGTTGTITNTLSTAYTDGDMIYDTPPTQVTSDLGNLLSYNSCNENYQSYITYTAVSNYTAYDQFDQLENYMCYSDDYKLNTFTKSQSQRMWGAFDPNYGSAPRSVLTSTANLVATGVNAWPTSCAAETGIVSGIFNYAIAANSGCGNVNIQFTNPTSLGFSTPGITSYSWNFGDSSGTVGGHNPVHTYTNSTSYTVTCTATNGSIVNTYSTVISTNFNVQIIGQSSQTGSVTASTVCKGMEQTIYVKFGSNIPSATITDGTNNYVVTNYMYLGQTDTIPYLFTANASASYSISPATCKGVSNGVASFNVINCCPTLITNGDFESTYTTTPTYGFATDLYYTTKSFSNNNNGAVQQYGDYDVDALVSGAYFSGSGGQYAPSSILNMTGKVLQVDGFAGNNTIVNIPFSCSQNPSPTPRIWQQTISGLQPNMPYMYSFKIQENWGNNCNGNKLNFQTSIASNTLTLLPAQTFTPVPDNLPASHLDFVVYTYTFTTPPTITSSSTFSVTINQVNTFVGGDFDFLMDNITLNQMTPGIQAVGSTTVCPTATVQINAVANCANAANYGYIWTPASGLSCTTCANPIANPGTTTVYTLVASPITNTLGIYPTYVSTVTVTINPAPIITISGNTAICPGMSSTTLTTTGATTYTWQPGNSNADPVIFTPSVTTTYTVSGNAPGCTSTGTNTVTVLVNNTATTLTVTPSSSTICSNNSAITLTASGATTYTWFPAGTLSSNSLSSVAASPFTNTTYTVWGTNNGCIGTKTATVTVTSAPNPSITASSPYVCTGAGSSTLIGSGATTYTWSPPAGLSCTTCSVTSANPTASTTYTLTATANGCTSFTEYLLYVNTPSTLTVSASSAVICAGSTSTLTATGANTYTWSPASGLSCTSCSLTIASPTVNTTYTVAGTNASGCTSYTTVSIAMVGNVCSGTQPSSYTVSSSGTYSPTTGYIAQNLYINSPASYTISSAEVRMAPTVSITVANGAVLTVNGSWLHACGGCSGSMWQGIDVQYGGTLVIENYSIIEDAISAVAVAPTTFSTTVANYRISNTIFNNNTAGITLNQNNGNLSGSEVYNTVFTCRKISNHTISSANFNAIKKDIRLATPTYTSSVNPTDLTLAGARAQYGMYINKVFAAKANINIGSGSVANNLFDNLDYGIFAIKSNVVAKNCRFQNLTGNSYNYPTNAPIGVGIYSYQNDVTNTLLTAGNSTITLNNTERDTFVNCLEGIYTYGVLSEFVNNNYFDNEITYPVSTCTTQGAHVTGLYGVCNYQFATTSSPTNVEQLNFANNTCKNYATAHFLDFCKINNTAQASIYFISNTIGSYTTALGANNYCNYGLMLQQSGTFGANTGVQANAIDIVSNSITNVTTNCINVNSVNSATATAGFMLIQKSTDLSVQYANTYTSSGVAAIKISNSNFIKVSDNTSIHSLNSGTYSATNNQFIAGVYVTQSINSTINCNHVTNMGEAFTWDGSSHSSTWKENTMNNSRYGLVLRGQGVMGDQGSAGNPIFDLWGKSGTDITSAQTLCDATDPGASGASSKLFGLISACTATSTPLPCVNNWLTNPTPYSASTLSVTTGSSPGLCATDGGGGGGSQVVTGGTMSAASTSSASSAPSNATLQSYVTSNPALALYNTETRWANQYYVNSVTQSIAAAGGYANAKAIALIDGEIAAGNFASAQSQNNALSPTNIIETNWQQVNAVVLKQALGSYTLTASDISSLQAVAAQCHTTGGSIVWKARAMLNAHFGIISEYPDACTVKASTGARLTNTTETTNESLLENPAIRLYPNPNNGSMLLDYTIKADARLEISDLTGNLVGIYPMSATENTIQVKNNYLQNAVYFYRVICNDAVIKLGKIVIMQ